MFSENRMVDPRGSSSIKEYKRDLEGEAKHLLNKIKTFTNLYEALVTLMQSNFTYQIIDSTDDRNYILTLIGGLHLTIPPLQAEYDSILAEMEKEASK